MLIIACPHCGPRDVAEYAYRGDASVSRPDPEAGIDAFHDWIYPRANPRGWHLEWWQHRAGCRRFLKVVRHTMTHEILRVATATESVEVPANTDIAPAVAS